MGEKVLLIRELIEVVKTINDSTYNRLEYKLEILFYKDKIVMTARNGNFDNIHETLQRVNDAFWDDFQQLYPNDWNHIIINQKYYTFLTIGSPQLSELNWKINVLYSDSAVVYTIYNMEQE